MEINDSLKRHKQITKIANQQELIQESIEQIILLNNSISETLSCIPDCYENKFSKNKKSKKFMPIHKNNRRICIRGKHKPKEIVICLDDD